MWYMSGRFSASQTKTLAFVFLLNTVRPTAFNGSY